MNRSARGRASELPLNACLFQYCVGRAGHLDSGWQSYSGFGAASNNVTAAGISFDLVAFLCQELPDSTLTACHGLRVNFRMQFHVPDVIWLSGSCAAAILVPAVFNPDCQLRCIARLESVV